MKKFLIVLSVLISVGLSWFFFHKKSDEKNPVLQLSRIIDEHIVKILGPLDSNAVPVDSHAVRKLREALRDGTVRGNKDEIQVYESAVKVCGTLLSLLEERENHSIRVRHILSNTNTSELSNSPEEDKERRVKFFVAGVERSWVEKVKIYRKRLDKEYAELRRMERLLNSNTN